MWTSGSSKRNQTQKSSRFVYVILVLLAIFSALGLDYVNWKKGDKSYLLPVLAGRMAEREKEASLQEIVLDSFSLEGIPEKAVNMFKDADGTHHLMVNIALEQYKPLLSRLKKALFQSEVSVLEKEQREDVKTSYFLWEVMGREREKLTILFSCQKESLEKVRAPSALKPKNKIALIMDDMGYSLGTIYDVLNLQQPITVAILPFSPLAMETAQIAHQNGMEILLHLPLESINNNQENNGIEGIITSNMTEQEIIKVLDNNLDQVPYISGVNNHMGSKITPNESMMHTILRRLKERNLFFIDSRTTGKSVAYSVARQLHIPSAERHVFLDVDPDENAIKKKLIELFTLGQNRGMAVGICHPLPNTLKVLKENFHLVEQYEVTPVFVSEIIR